MNRLVAAAGHRPAGLTGRAAGRQGGHRFFAGGSSPVPHVRLPFSLSLFSVRVHRSNSAGALGRAGISWALNRNQLSSMRIMDDMASIYRPTSIRYLDADGKQVPKGTPGAIRKRVRSKTWRARYTDASGNDKTASLKTQDRQEAQERLAELLQRVKQHQADPFAEHREKPLSEHLADFSAYLAAKDNTDRYIRLTVNRVTQATHACRFRSVTELDSGRAAGWLRDQRRDAMSPATSNHYVTALKTFGNWLHRDRRTPENPFEHLSRVNAKVDVRCVRRSLQREELTRLITAAADGKPFRDLSGQDRAVLYTLAVFTGLRVSELASLTERSLNLDHEPPTVTVDAACSKHRREDVLPLHPALADQLRNWLANLTERSGSADESTPLFPGTWTERAAPMLRRDLAAARRTWIDEAVGDQQQQAREKSGFLQAETPDGRIDFHALRHSFITNLATSGVHPKLAKELARHSTIALTMDRYAHVDLNEMNAALSTVPGLPQSVDLTVSTADAVSVAPQVAQETVQLKSSQELSGVPTRTSRESESASNSTTDKDLRDVLITPEKWWGGDLNPRPAGYESAALTN